jgi:NACHT domain
MGQRRVLVIGSQCKALGGLDFLPKAAQELYRVMTDPERGACVSALEGEGLLIDPSVTVAKDAIETAYKRAAKDGATLFISYVGHGERVKDDYYLLPQDAQNPPRSGTAIHLTNLIKEVHNTTPGRIDGLGVLVDACYSGVAGFGAARAWIGDLEGTLRFELLTAAAADRPAANGCFSRTLARLLRQGVSAVPSEHLRCRHLRPLIEGLCPNQVPQHPSYNPDETLWLAKNGGRALECWAQTPLADEIQRLTQTYQLTPALSEVVARSRAQCCVAVVGDAGRGKSALAAALAWPKLVEGTVPVGFAHAVALLNEATTPQELSRVLTEQLARSVPGFGEAQAHFTRETPYAEQQRLGALEKRLVGPLRRLAPGTEVRLIVDALDRLATGARGSVMDGLNELAELPFLRLVVTARPDTELPKAAATYVLAPAANEKVSEYLDRRGILQVRREEVTKAAEGNWLVVRVLADLLCERSDADIGAGQLALGDAYEEMLSRCGVTDNENAQGVLAILAAAGAGPLLPIALLCAASEALGGPGTAAGVRDELFRLRGLAVRAAAGTDAEHAGLFHQTLVEHVAARAPQAALAAHRALATSIHALAPTASGPVQMDDAVQRYAFEREIEHLWTLGETFQAVESLSTRTSPVPRDNLRRWELWAPRVAATFGLDHPATLKTRNKIAFWTGKCGDAREALRLLTALLPDQERVLGLRSRIRPELCGSRD